MRIVIGAKRWGLEAWLALGVLLFGATFTWSQSGPSKPSTQPDLVLDEAELRILSPSEIEFLKINCPQSTEVINSGIAVVHGFILRPPILVSVNRDRVHLNGIQVLPPEARPKYYSAKKFVDRLQAQYLDGKRKGVADPLAPVLAQAQELTTAGQIEKFAVIEGDHRQLSVTADGREWHWVLDTCSSLTTAKRHYIIEQLLWTYTNRKGTDLEAALRWLRSRLDDLKQMGIISTYRLDEEDETVFVRFDCALTDNAFGFYNPRTKRAREYEKSWKTGRPETEARRSSVAQVLGAGKLFLHSYEFEKSVPYDAEVFGQLERVRRGVASRDTAESIKGKMRLSQKQAQALLDEAR